MNIGVKPTIAKNLKRTIEVYIIDFSEDIYGENAEVKIVRRLRGELSFDNINALKTQIETDVKRVITGK
jgi:riboflavin kinase/FMN adenylyltransferase